MANRKNMVLEFDYPCGHGGKHKYPAEMFAPGTTEVYTCGTCGKTYLIVPMTQEVLDAVTASGEGSVIFLLVQG